MNKRRIVDAHHHLWDLHACHYPWLMARGVKRFFGDPTPIQRDYQVADFRTDASDYELLASVHVQVGVVAGDELKETRWLQENWEQQGLPSAIVAYCDLDATTAPRRLEEQAQHSRLRGIRQIVGRSAEEDAGTGSGALPDNLLWREHLGLLRDLGLSFDLQLVPDQLTRVAAVLARTPGLKVALCHSGSPWDQTDAGLASWREGLRELAALPDVYCKLSGFGMFDHHWTVSSVRPLIESCVEIFGPDRCMFGSNFPVDKLYVSYKRLWRVYEEIVSGLGADEQDRVFAGTAKEFYRL